MHQWYHSGLEGYCKAAARVMGLPEDNSGWGNFGRDLFADGRFDDPAKASKAWVLSRFRAQGRSNRLNLFEDSWLGQHGSDYELQAIHTCVHGMCAAGEESTLYELYRSSPDTFAARFHDDVLPSIAEGFEAERYHPSDIASFSQGIDHALGKLNPQLPQTFRSFAIPLVAGLIYGPDHVTARTGTNSATLRRARDEGAEYLPPAAIDASAIVLTQLFSEDAGFVGHTGVYGANHAILLGRGSNFSDYLAACDCELAGMLGQKEPVSFPVAHTHKHTSKAHGVIACVDGSWYYYDFSSNGSYIENARRPSAVHQGAVALASGDRIYLGLTSSPDNDPTAYRLATTILVSFKVDETGF